MDTPQDWAAHPRWYEHAYEPLVGFHDRYRARAAALIVRCEDRAADLDAVHAELDLLSEQLHNHEAVEEEWLYPWVAARTGFDFAEQVAEHLRLNAQVEAAQAACAIGRAELRAALVDLEGTLRAHLAAEEAVCVPALLSSSPADIAALLGVDHA